MTIRECIRGSLDLINIGEVEIDGKQQKSYQVLPLTVPYMITGLANILLVDAALRSGVKVEKSESLRKVMRVLNQQDFLNSLGQFMQLQGFLRWWLDTDEKDWYKETEDGWENWPVLTQLIEAWNKYAEINQTGGAK